MKEKLLFIAPHVPLYDQGSGDLRLFSLVKILSRNYEITYIAQSALNSTSYDESRYEASLRELGINVHVQGLSIAEVLRTNRFKAAILEFYFVAEHYLQRIRVLQPSCPVIIDTVDVHYARYFSKYRVSGDRNDLQHAEEIKKRELEIYRKSDMVLAVTPEDAEQLLRDLPELAVRTVPNVHQPVRLADTDAQRNGLIFVGGFDHEPNADAMIYFCRDIFPLIQARLPGITLAIVGSNPPQHVRDLGNDHITVTGYVPSTTPFLQNSLVSVAPLRYGAGMKGKIGEAMAHRLPVVTTSVGASGLGLVNRKNAMIADTPEDFAAAVVELLQDDVLYRSIRQNAADHIASNFMEEQVGKKLEGILKETERIPVKKMSLPDKTSFLFSYAYDLAKRKLHLV